MFTFIDASFWFLCKGLDPCKLPPVFSESQFTAVPFVIRVVMNASAFPNPQAVSYDLLLYVTSYFLEGETCLLTLPSPSSLQEDIVLPESVWWALPSPCPMAQFDEWSIVEADYTIVVFAAGSTHTKLELDMEGLSEFEQELQEELEAAGACIYLKMGTNQA